MRKNPTFIASILLSSMVHANFTDFVNVSGDPHEQPKVLAQFSGDLNPNYQPMLVTLCQFNVTRNDTRHFRFENRTQQLEDQVGRFVQHLKSFIKETSFSILKFEPKIVELKENLTKLHDSVVLETQSPSLQQQFQFLTNMFLVMVESTRAMDSFRIFRNPGYPLIYKVLELRVRALALYNSYGMLDLHTDGYVTELSRLHASLYFWGEKFHKITPASPRVIKVFQEYFRRADETFQLLESQIPQV